jgi:hypothetical protein
VLVLDRPDLTPFHAAQRLRWALEYAHFNPEDWARDFWSDECSVERGIGERREYTFTPRNKRVETGDVRGLPTPGKETKQMFWAVFSGSSRRIPLFGNPASTRGGVDCFVILELYRRFLPTFAPKPR